jgi:Spy/CpxP family protein refolding chaperone
VFLLVLPVQAEEAAKKQSGPRFDPAGRGMGGMGSGKLALLSREQVQTELKITAEQKEQINAVQTGLREKMRELMPARGQGGQGGQGATAEERQKRMAEMQAKRQQLTEESEKKLATILKPEQSKRLGEISLQQRGVQGLKDKEVVEALKITKEQTDKIDAALKWGQEEQQKLFQESRGQGAGRDAAARTAMREKQEKIRAETETKALAALTDAQKEQLTKMKGAVLKLEPMTPRTGGGAGGPGGGPRGGRRGQGNT